MKIYKKIKTTIIMKKKTKTIFILMTNVKHLFFILMEKKEIIIQWVFEIIHLLVAITILSGLFYIRLLPRVSRDLWEQMTYSQIARTLISIILIIIHIYIFFKLLKKDPWSKNNIGIFSRLKEKLLKIKDYFFWTMKNLYRFFIVIVEQLVVFIFKYTALNHKIMLILSRKVLALPKTIIFWVLIAINGIPKFIFVFIFCYEVFYAHHLHYTFKCIPLLLLSLIELFIIFLFDNFHESHWNEVCSLVIQKEIAPNSNLYYYEYIPELKANPPDFVKDFKDFFQNHLMVFFRIKKLTEEYYSWKYKIFGYIEICLILCSLRLFALLFLLIYGIT